MAAIASKPNTRSLLPWEHISAPPPAVANGATSIGRSTRPAFGRQTMRGSRFDVKRGNRAGGAGGWPKIRLRRRNQAVARQGCRNASPCSSARSSYYWAALEVPLGLVLAARRFAPARDVLARDHVLVAHPGGHHRVDVRGLVDHHLEERRAAEADELLECGPHVGDRRHPAGESEPVGLDGLHEVLLVQRLAAAPVTV